MGFCKECGQLVPDWKDVTGECDVSIKGISRQPYIAVSHNGRYLFYTGNEIHILNQGKFGDYRVELSEEGNYCGSFKIWKKEEDE